MTVRTRTDRLLAVLLRPTTPPLWLGLVVAAVFITAETVLVYRLRELAPENAFGALFLLGVLVVSAGWGFWLAVGTSVASAVVYVYFHMDTNGAIVPIHPQDAVAILIFLPVALLANILAGQARVRAAEAEQRRREADALAEQQAALRRVATLVARGTMPSEVFPMAVAELSRGLGADNVALLQYETDSAVVLLAARDEKAAAKMAIGERFSLAGESVAALIHDTGAPARMDSFDGVTGSDRGARARARAALGGRRAHPGGRRDMGCVGDRARRSPNHCHPKPRPASGISPILSPPPSPTPKRARNSPPHVRAS